MRRFESSVSGLVDANLNWMCLGFAVGNEYDSPFLYDISAPTGLTNLIVIRIT